MLVQILVDNPNSWIMPYAAVLVNEIKKRIKCNAIIIFSHEEVVTGDVLCMLSCEKIFKKLNLNKYNLVVHESALPKGKGWSPVTWQVLENINKIPVTLFEAVENIDAGPIYMQDYIYLKGDELLPEIKDLQGKVTNKLILDFLSEYPNVFGKKQTGEESFYEKRNQKNSELDINKSIKEQFNLLRICDNERYPAYIVVNDVKYLIKIEKSS